MSATPIVPRHVFGVPWWFVFRFLVAAVVGGTAGLWVAFTWLV